MSRKIVYRRVLLFILFFSLVYAGVFGYETMKATLPDKINIVVNEEQRFDFHLPIHVTITPEYAEASEFHKSNVPKSELHVNMQKPFSIRSSNLGSYSMKCKLLGIFDLKKVQLNVIEKQYLLASGEAVGIYIQTDGVLVLGTSTVTDIAGVNYEPAYSIVQSGDYIISVNGEKISNKNDLIEKVRQYGEKDLILQLRRNKAKIDIKLHPVQTGMSEYKLGIWVRDNTQGIGTLTFYDAGGNFGALGHGISDVDTSKLMELDFGTLYKTNIVSIIKGTDGSPGELTGTIDYQPGNVLGTITSNTAQGIFGDSRKLRYDYKQSNTLEVGMKEEVTKGAAQIRCCIDGTVMDYDIIITELNTGGDNVNKGIIFEVVDPDLLKLTGGIVQGMSGSPIIQNGKLVGAVTHVYIQDAKKGFGIFIENMLKAQSK